MKNSKINQITCTRFERILFCFFSLIKSDGYNLYRIYVDKESLKLQEVLKVLKISNFMYIPFASFVLLQGRKFAKKKNASAKWIGFSDGLCHFKICGH